MRYRNSCFSFPNSLSDIFSLNTGVEDYRGPSSSGYFKWMPDENGNVQPVTRMKEKNVERKVPSFWGNNDE